MRKLLEKTSVFRPPLVFDICQSLKLILELNEGNWKGSTSLPKRSWNFNLISSGTPAVKIRVDDFVIVLSWKCSTGPAWIFLQVGKPRTLSPLHVSQIWYLPAFEALKTISRVWLSSDSIKETRETGWSSQWTWASYKKRSILVPILPKSTDRWRLLVWN